LSPTNVRIVVDCSKGINDSTQHYARQMDSVQRILQLAAPHTRKGYIAQIDISSMFHCFVLAKDLWPHFVVNHPKMGEMCYCRLPMGWISSPAIARELVTRIMYSHCSGLLSPVKLRTRGNGREKVGGVVYGADDDWESKFQIELKIVALSRQE
jgi:hypothetical protein